MFPTRALSGSAQLLGMVLEGRGVHRALFLAPYEAGLPAVFGGAFGRLDVLHHDYAFYRADRGQEAARGDLVFAYRWEGPWDHELAVLFHPKEKELAALLLRDVGRRLAPGATVIVVGPKQGGILSAGAAFEANVGPLAGRRSARHAVLLQAVVAREAEEPETEDPEPEARTFPVEAFGCRFHAVSVPGVFSHGRVDAGTGFLLATWQPGTFRRALDWGCGSGVIGTALQLARSLSTVDLVDVHAGAVRAARATLAGNGLDPERVRPSDGFSDVEGLYDLIVTNPPLHRGLRPDRARTESFLEAAGAYLVPGGRLVLVTQAAAPVVEPLRDAYGDLRVVATDGRFRVVEARRGAPKAVRPKEI